MGKDGVKMEKRKVDIVIIVLVYRNYEDLCDLINSVKEKIHQSYRIVVVNAFYDEATETQTKKVAQNYDCDFINIDNKGYSFGNNTGITYAVEHYEFNYIIVSNPDIVISKFPDNINNLCGGIIAPKIIAASGKNQNPMIVKENLVAEKLVYNGFKRHNKFLILCGIGINKVKREFFLARKKGMVPIFAAHGSFVIISQSAINVLGERPYDENMFLFAEESVLAVKAKNAGIDTVYCPDIYVNHKEDGSMRLGGFSINEELAKANIYYYETYRKRGK